MQFEDDHNIRYLTVGLFSSVLFLCAFFGYLLFISLFFPGGKGKVQVVISNESGVFDVAKEVVSARLVRSSFAFAGYAILSGAWNDLKPGAYIFDATDRTPKIIRAFVAGPSREVEVTIVEGSTIYDIDAVLAESGVLKKGSFISRIFPSSISAEGKLFPDTYRFYVSSTPNEVLEKMIQNFRERTDELLAGRPDGGADDLVLASLLEREVSDFSDRQIVAGILKKRLKGGMALQVDASICYIKEAKTRVSNCYPLSSLDFKIDSPYNTYLNKGLPPGPIGNPGIEAIRAALQPVDSPYWFYLSDPKTGKTIFSQTLDRHEENRVKYLLKNS